MIKEKTVFIHNHVIGKRMVIRLNSSSAINAIKYLTAVMAYRDRVSEYGSTHVFRMVGRKPRTSILMRSIMDRSG